MISALALSFRSATSLQIGDAAGVAVDGGNVITQVQEMTGVPATAAGHVEHGPSRRREGREAAHPGGRLGGFVVGVR